MCAASRFCLVLFTSHACESLFSVNHAETKIHGKPALEVFFLTKNLELKTDSFFQLTIRRSDASACRASE